MIAHNLRAASGLHREPVHPPPPPFLGGWPPPWQTHRSWEAHKSSARLQAERLELRMPANAGDAAGSEADVSAARVAGRARVTHLQTMATDRAPVITGAAPRLVLRPHSVRQLDSHLTILLQMRRSCCIAAASCST